MMPHDSRASYSSVASSPVAMKQKCSFCGKGQDQVARLIAGPGVHICDECVRLCVAILWEDVNLPESSRQPG